jgi:hypothetical protein
MKFNRLRDATGLPPPQPAAEIPTQARSISGQRFEVVPSHFTFGVVFGMISERRQFGVRVHSGGASLDGHVNAAKCEMWIPRKNPLFSKRSDLRDHQNTPTTQEKPLISDPGESYA